ncbi:MAG: DUF177 domain-containing protein [Flavobacteriales bacterium]
MESESKYIIPFVGLKEGKHEFVFTENEEFFESYKYDYVQDVKFTATVNLHKMSTMLILDLTLTGNYSTQCDRCGDDLIQDFETEDRLYFKYGEGESEDESIVFLDQSQYEIDFAEYIFEYFVTSVALSHIHQEGDCNKEVLKKIEELRVKDIKNESNPMWDKLKDLK